MTVAIACGLAAAYITSSFFPIQTEKVGVLVAKHDITMGVLVADPEALFVEKLFTKGEEPKWAIRSFDEVKGRRLNRSVSQDQFVTASDLNDKKDDLAGVIPTGMRAVALKTTAESQVAGFVQPQSHVDVISTVPNPNGATSSKTILQNILVLAVDQRHERPEEIHPVVASTVTVLVKPEQAEQLATAQRIGTISLSLRAFDDPTEIRAPVVEGRSAPNALEAESRPPKFYMDIYNGPNLTTAEFDG